MKEDAIELRLKEVGVPDKLGADIRNAFMPFWDKADTWSAEAKKIVVTNSSQIREMQRAREARLELKNIRVEVEKTRKALKEESLRRNKAIDGVANIIKYLIVPIEKHLQQQEDFAKIEEENKRREIYLQRKAEIMRWGVEDPSYLGLDKMPEDHWKLLLSNTKAAYLLNLEKEKKEEEERKRIELERMEEEKRIRKENERLREEAAKAEAAAKKERIRQQKIIATQKAKAAEEKRKRERAERILKMKKEAEEKKDRELREKKEREERRLLMAPDKVKLMEYAVLLSEASAPIVYSEEARAILDRSVKALAQAIKILRDGCKELDEGKE